MCRPHTCSTAHIRDVGIIMTSPSSRFTVHPITRGLPYEHYSSIFQVLCFPMGHASLSRSPKRVKLHCYMVLLLLGLKELSHIILDPFLKIYLFSRNKRTWDLERRTSSRNQKVLKDELVHCWFWSFHNFSLLTAIKMLNIASTILYHLFFSLAVLFFLFFSFSSLYFPYPSPSEPADLRHFSDTSGSRAAADRSDGSH